MRIAVYAICKNEEAFIDRFVASALEADQILIADTGSTDGTFEKLLQTAHVTTRRITVTPWRFDDARTAALALVDDDIDVCISLDLDEILQPGWRAEIERVWKLGETTRLRYGFDWGHNIVFAYEKIHARRGYRWHHPCHEYPVPDGRITEVWAHTDMLLVRHHPDPTKSRGQYLDILKLSVAEDPDCPRNSFYYGRELGFYRMHVEAERELLRYLALPRATWPNERCYAMRILAKCRAEQGDPLGAVRWLRLACAEAPNTREPWCELAVDAYRRADWQESLYAAEKALAIREKALVYTCDPEVWGPLAHDYAAIAAWNLGQLDLAQRRAAEALALGPDDPRLADNLAKIRASLAQTGLPQAA